MEGGIPRGNRGLCLISQVAYLSHMGEQLTFVSNALMVLYHQWDQLDSVYQYNWNFSNLEVSCDSVVFEIPPPTQLFFACDVGCIVLF